MAVDEYIIKYVYYSSICNSRYITKTMNLHIIMNFIFEILSTSNRMLIKRGNDRAKFSIAEQDQQGLNTYQPIDNFHNFCKYGTSSEYQIYMLFLSNLSLGGLINLREMVWQHKEN